MAMTRLVVLAVPEELRPTLDYEARVFVGSDVVLHVNSNVAAMLGEQAVDGFEVQMLGDSLSGYVKSMPQAGDELRIALNSGEFVSTGLTFQPEPSGPIV
jgi:hypothetical protein